MAQRNPAVPPALSVPAPGLAGRGGRILAALALASLPSLGQAGPPRPDAGQAGAGQAVTAAASLIRIEPGQLSAQVALRLELDIASHDGRFATGEANEVIAYPDDLEALDARGVAYTVVHPDLEAFYLSRLTPGGVAEAAGGYGAWLTPAFAQGGMGGYYTFAEIESVLDQIHAAYPTLTTAKTSIGTTLEGRPQWMIKISDNPDVDESEPEVRYDALHHAREPQGMQTTLWFMLYLLEEYGSDPAATYLVDHRELYFIPCVNPDGYEYNRSTNPGGGGLWRKNRRDNGGGDFGVDLNRNYDAFWGYDDTGSSPTPSSETYRGTGPASEPEVVNMQAFLSSRSFATAQSNHTYSNLWLYPYGYDAFLPVNADDYVEVSALATAQNGYVAGPAATALYPANGVTFDYDHEIHGTMGWTPEIGSSADGFWPPTSRIVPLASENLSAFSTTAFAAGAFVRPDASFDEVGDGDGFFEPGETVVWPRLRNSGLAASPPVSIALSTASPFASLAKATDSAPTVPSFGDYTSGAPVSLFIQPGTPGGTRIDYDLTVTYDGYAQVVSGSFVVGELRPYLVDTLEVDRGWTAGLPGDDATTGLWELGDPIGTTSSGEEVNPEDDATPDPGVLAFMTGNGGGSAGNDDVDGGSTTLLSPLFDLSGVAGARLSYERWYALFTSLDDTLEVAISSDAGASWTPLETVATSQNTWTRVQHELNGLVPFTETMQLRLIASDLNSGSLVEAAIDDLQVDVYDAEPRVHFYGPVTAGGSVQFNVSGQPGARYIVQWSSGVTAGQVGGSAQGSLAWNRLLPGQSSPLAGVIGGTGLDQVDLQVPGTPGVTLYYRVVTRFNGQGAASNAAKLVIP